MNHRRYTWIETQELTNTLYNLHGYSDAPIKYQQSKYFSINGIYWSYSLAANRGGLLSFGSLVGDNVDLWIEINENRFLGFWQHKTIPPMARNFCLADLKTINKINDTLHTRFLKYDIYQKIHFIRVQDIYPLPTHLAQAFKNWMIWSPTLCTQKI